jgi:aerobic-type carbon monoxide dehydrogenase small subunit (CoxS/CutS family)
MVVESRKLVINGEPKTVSAPDDMPLLWVLRDIAWYRA